MYSVNKTMNRFLCSDLESFTKNLDIFEKTVAK